MSASDPEISKVLIALGHEKRRRIVQLLGERGALSVSELKREMKVSTGSLYHNISLLGDLLSQDRDRRYVLTEKGRRINELLSSGVLSEVREPFGGRLRSLMNLLIPRWIFLSLSESRLARISIMAAVIVGWIALAYPTKSTIMLLLVERTGSNLILQSLSLPLSWLAVSSILLIVFARRDLRSANSLKFLSCSAISYLPQVLYLVLERALSGTAVGNLLGNPIIFGVASLLFSGVGVCLLSAALVVNLKVPIRSALIACFVIFYTSSVLSTLGRGA
ncbi:MAG: winged helix-turn-helix domain-containing protein [Thermoproteota archaeon]